MRESRIYLTILFYTPRGSIIYLRRGDRERGDHMDDRRVRRPRAAALLLLLLLGAGIGRHAVAVATKIATEACSCVKGHGICLPGDATCFCSPAAGQALPALWNHATHDVLYMASVSVKTEKGSPKKCECDRGWSGRAVLR